MCGGSEVQYAIGLRGAYGLKEKNREKEKNEREIKQNI